MFPIDAITQTFFLEGVVTSTIVTSTTPTTILGVHMQQSGLQSETVLLCGTDEVAKNFDKDYQLDLIQFDCNGAISLSKTGVADDAFVSVTYVPRKIAHSTQESFTQGFAQGFSYDGIVITVLLMLIFSTVIYDLLQRWTRGNKIKQ